MNLSDPTPGADAAEWAGRVLVALQFGFLAVMGWRAWVSPIDLEILALAAALLAASAWIAVWALTANRPGNFNIRLTPRPGGTLVTTGPYAWIRHPMYTSVLGAAAAAATQSHQSVDGLLWLALLAVLLAKAVMEERALLRRFPDYQAYKARTTRFLPGLV
jgi:protein-S-isoprenylcysteine O-methyltransferase Ste14